MDFDYFQSTRSWDSSLAVFCFYVSVDMSVLLVGLLEEISKTIPPCQESRRPKHLGVVFHEAFSLPGIAWNTPETWFPESRWNSEVGRAEPHILRSCPPPLEEWTHNLSLRKSPRSNREVCSHPSIYRQRIERVILSQEVSDVGVSMAVVKCHDQ